MKEGAPTQGYSVFRPWRDHNCCQRTQQWARLAHSKSPAGCHKPRLVCGKPPAGVPWAWLMKGRKCPMRCHEGGYAGCCPRGCCGSELCTESRQCTLGKLTGDGRQTQEGNHVQEWVSHMPPSCHSIGARRAHPPEIFAMPSVSCQHPLLTK